jgi:hypothetical protein
MPFPLPAFWIPGFQGSVRLNGKRCTLLVPVVHRQSVVAVVLATEVPGTGGAPQGVIGTKMSSASISGSTALGGAGSTLGSSDAMSPELPGLYLPVRSTLRPHPLIGGGWRAKESWRVCMSPQRSGCSTRHWPQSTATFFIWSRSVYERKGKKSFPYPQWLPLCLHAFLHVLFS